MDKNGQVARVKRGLWVALMALLLPYSTYAAQAPATASADTAGAAGAAAPAEGLEEIIVTAERREESLQSVPVAVTVLSSADIQSKRIETAQDLQQYVPSMAAYTFSAFRDGTSFSLRGQSVILGAPASVVTYLNEVPLSETQSSNSNGGGPGLYLDLENLQVLNGPQGTLFGRNTTGGAVLFQSKRPTDKFEGYVQAGVGNYNDRQYEGVFNVPLVGNQLLLRVAASRQTRDGFTRNIANGQELDSRDNWAARATLSFLPTDSIRNDFIVYATSSQSTGTSHLLTMVNPNPVLTLGPGFSVPISFFFPTIGQLLAQQQALGIRSTDNAGPTPESADYRSVTDIAKWDITDAVALKNIAAYQSNKGVTNGDIDGTALPILTSYRDSNVTTISEELQLQGKSLADNLVWTAGAYYDFTRPIGVQNQNAILFLGTFDSTTGTRSRSRAVYAQGSYDFGGLASALRGLKFTGGYRYTWDSRDDFFHGYSPNPAPPPAVFCTAGTPATNCTVSAFGEKSSAGSWTTGLDYQIDPKTLVYVKVSRGYKGGGFNTAGLDPRHQIFRPEYVLQTEVGLKRDWIFDPVELRTDIAAFHSSYTDIQKDTFAVINGAPVTFADNVAEARINGVEFSGTLVPGRLVDFSWNYSYLDAKYTKSIPAAPGAPLFDISLPFYATPTQKFSVGGTLHIPVPSELGKLSLSANYTHTSDLFVFTDREPGDTISGYGLLNFSADWEDIAGKPLDLHFFMNNATNRDYAVGSASYYSSFGIVSRTYGEPMMYGFQLRYRWGPDAPSLF